MSTKATESNELNVGHKAEASKKAPPASIVRHGCRHRRQRINPMSCPCPVRSQHSGCCFSFCPRTKSFRERKAAAPCLETACKSLWESSCTAGTAFPVAAASINLEQLSTVLVSFSCASATASCDAIGTCSMASPSFPTLSSSFFLMSFNAGKTLTAAAGRGLTLSFQLLFLLPLPLQGLFLFIGKRASLALAFHRLSGQQQV